MLDSVLFTAGNRVLGGAIGDFSLYGGQTEPGVSVGPAPQGDGGTAQPPAALMPEMAAPAPGAPHGIAPDQPVSLSGGAADAPSFHAPLLFASPAAPSLASSDADIGAPAVQALAASPGAGSPIPEPALPSHAAMPATDFGLPHPSDLLDVPLGIGPAGVGDTAADTLHSTVGALDDTLSDLAGADPLGGVATLVSLISVTDLFDLHPAGAEGAEAGGDLGLGIVDTLVGEEVLPDALLGGDDHHHDGGGLGHALDHALGL